MMSGITEKHAVPPHCNIMHKTDRQKWILLQRSAKASFASAVYATANPSVRHTPALRQNEGTQRDAVGTDRRGHGQAYS